MALAVALGVGIGLMPLRLGFGSEILARTRALPRGTVGKPMPVARSARPNLPWAVHQTISWVSWLR